VTGEQIALLGTNNGTKAISLGRIQDILLPENGATKLSQSTRKPRLTLHVKGAQNGQAEVGYLSVQKGFRWIPNYKVTLDSNNNAHVELQATLVNDLADLSDATVHLIVGVPSFVMKDQLDPIALQETVAQVVAQENFALSNGISNRNMMNAQISAGSYARLPQTQPSDNAGTIEGEKNEDLFLFSVKNITLKKGERMTIPVSKTTIPYKNLYTLDLYPTLANEVYRNFGGSPPSELERLRQAPQVMHKIRLLNQSQLPLTTAPALIFKNNQVIAQGMMTYTPAGGKSDISLTNAIDIGIRRSDTESKRSEFVWQGTTMIRVDMKGLIDVTNYRNEPVNIEVNRYVNGLFDTANTGGVISALDTLSGDSLPLWWTMGSFYGFNQRDGLGKATWTLTIKPSECIKLGYMWHYTKG
jgi:hypothetical protein